MIFLCHRGNQSTIESQQKVTREKITAISWREKFCFDPECTWDGKNKEQRRKISLSLGKGKLKNNANHNRRTETQKEKKMMWSICAVQFCED